MKRLMRQAEVFFLGEETLIVRIGTDGAAGAGGTPGIVKADGTGAARLHRAHLPARGDSPHGGGRPSADDVKSAMHVLLALAAKIEAEAPPGLRELVPAGRALAICFDPLKMDHEAWQGRLDRWLAELAPIGETGSRTVEIPVCYGGDAGPDLAEVARMTGMNEEEVIRLHGSVTYTVGMIGFAPGFPYLLGLPERLAVPRRAVPRTAVPAGSVAIGGGQTGIYPTDLPGGWHIIGRTSLALFDPAASPPSLLAPGDRVRFVPVDAWPIAPSPAASAAESGSGSTSAASDSVTGFLVKKPGLYTTLQDAGRPGLQKFGVSPGGAMDMASCRLANRLVGNRGDEPVLEMTLAGPELDVLEDMWMAICGADMEATVNGRPLATGRPIRVKRGDRLRFAAARAGCRTYLAVAGGFAVPPLLGGSGAYPAAGLPGLLGRALAAGDKLPVRRQGGAAALAKSLSGHMTRRVRWRLAPPVPPPVPGQTVAIRVVPGPEFGRLSPEGVRLLLEQAFTVMPQSNRMGLRLAGNEPIPSPAAESAAGMVSEPVAPGTVQLPAGGQPIILAADRQTTGGYPRVLQVIAADRPLLGQMAPGAKLVFQLTDLEEAIARMAEQERSMRLMAWAIDQRRMDTGGDGQ